MPTTTDRSESHFYSKRHPSHALESSCDRSQTTRTATQPRSGIDSKHVQKDSVHRVSQLSTVAQSDASALPAVTLSANARCCWQLRLCELFDERMPHLRRAASTTIRTASRAPSSAPAARPRPQHPGQPPRAAALHTRRCTEMQSGVSFLASLPAARSTYRPPISSSNGKLWGLKTEHRAAGERSSDGRCHHPTPGKISGEPA